MSACQFDCHLYYHDFSGEQANASKQY
uniref:Uncharacterized protein n=1 Tax=Anguilla anguilla TaxID=7936 RepID=A0A0E9W5F4_ANGAN